MPIIVNDDVLVKCLLGEASAEEQQAVEAWKQLSEANKKYFDHLSLIWEQSSKITFNTTITTEDAWQRFNNRIAQDNSEVQQNEQLLPKTRTINLNVFGWAKIAAAIIILFGGGWFLYQSSGLVDDTITIASHEGVLIHKLPDGSTVTLNKNAQLTYDEKLDGATRSVALQGEAFFEISPDKQHPFVIAAGNSQITVVGTSFNVKSWNKKTEVIVETGIVEVAGAKKAVRINKGERVVVDGDKDPMADKVTDELYNYYRTNEFVCNGTPLGKLIETLNEAYNVHIVLANPKLATLPYNNTFSNETLDNILKVVCSTFNLSADVNAEYIVLKEKNVTP